jgi:Protein of unknown function (DUF2934)
MDSQQNPAVAEASVKVLSSATENDLTSLLAALEHETIAALAYRYWDERGCPGRSAEVDWFQAERDMHNKSEVGPSFRDDPEG